MTDALHHHTFPTRSPDTGAAAQRVDDLPHWNLADLYDGTEDPRIATDLAQAGEAAKAFNDAYKGRLADLSGDDLGKAVADAPELDATPIGGAP